MPFGPDGRTAGPPQLVAGTTDHEDFAKVAGDGNGRFLAIWNENYLLMERPLDENGAPTGPGHYIGSGDAAVSWNGSAFVVVNGGDVVVVAADGNVLSRQTWAIGFNPRQTVIAGDTIATLHSGIDAGIGDANVVFVTRFTPGRHRATRP